MFFSPSLSFIRLFERVALTNISTFPGNLCPSASPQWPCFVRSNFTSSRHFDLVVIGGGSGGIACAKEAVGLGASVAVVDYVERSPQGSSWGLGGTCVNVGCIPKKLFHVAALHGDSIKESHIYGWNSHSSGHNWSVLRDHVQGHIKSLNWNYRVQLLQNNISYFNSIASFLDHQAVRLIVPGEKDFSISGTNIVLAVGGRPAYPDVEGAGVYGITSDDIWFSDNPGKCLVIGGGYIALETAGFLRGLGFEVSVMVRSLPLRSFDQEMVSFLVSDMEARGVKFLNRCTPQSLVSSPNGCLVSWRNESASIISSNTFNTVLFAIGRRPATKNLGLEDLGVKVDPNSGHVHGNVNGEMERIHADYNLFAVGDVLKGVPELTPVASKAGSLLARRLFDGSDRHMNYSQVATTVFTPLEYSCVGMSEEDALEAVGDASVEILHARFQHGFKGVFEEEHTQCFAKVICKRNFPQIILGIHFLGPNAGEVMQGFSLALSKGITLEDIQSCVGIHPTNAEELVKLHITKRSGKDPNLTAC